jgi:ATP-dependent Clp protease protease subunit
VKPISVFNYSVTNAADSVVDVQIDGAIVDAESQQIMKDWFGDETSVSFKSVRNQIEKVNPKTVNVHLNSPGGVVTDAMAIHDYLIELGTKGVTVNTYIKGMAASAATYVAMATENSHMSENSWFMIHNMSGAIYGDVNEIENYATMIRKFNNSARDFYAERTGIRKEDVTRMMNVETWLTASEAKEKGFIKNVTGAANFTNAIDPKNWPYQNKAVLNAYNSFTANNQIMDFSKVKEAVKNALVELGIKKPEDEAQVNVATEAITNAIAEQLKPFENLQETVQNLVTEAVKNITVAPDAITETVKNQVTESTKDFVKKEDLTKLENNIAEKLGGAAKEKEESNEERKINNKKSFYNVGSFQKN